MASCGQQIFGIKIPPTFSSPHIKLYLIRLGSFGWIGLQFNLDEIDIRVK